MSDPRFARLKNDPRFKRPKKDQHKIVVDKRFNSIFDETNKSKGGKKAGVAIDKYGRRISSKAQKDGLRKLYKLEGEDEETQAGPSFKSKGKGKAFDYARGEGLSESSSEEEQDATNEVDSADEDDVVTLAPHTFGAPKRKSRKLGITSDDSDIEINLDESEFADLDAQAAAASTSFNEQKRTTQKGEETSRLAIVNLDWDYVNAAHLYKAFVSSAAQMVEGPSDLDAQHTRKRRAPTFGTNSGNGKVLRVRVYPSEFGKQRMEKEDIEGPPTEIFGAVKKETKSILLTKGQDESEDELDPEEINEKTIFQEEDADAYDQEALRKYQLQRLRYFYAVAEFDSPETAAFVYNDLDGSELERTGNLFDLSFVPDGMEFDDAWRDEATQDLKTLQNLDYETSALKNSKVQLTWDDDDKARVEISKRAFSQKELEENDFKAYIASSSESEREGGDKAVERDRLRALLLGGGDGNGDDFFDTELPEGWGGSGKNKAGDLEITFTPGLSAAKKDESDEEGETTLDRYKKKMKDKKDFRMAKWEDKKEIWRRKQSGEEEPEESGDDFFDVPSDAESKPKKGGKESKKEPSASPPTHRKPSTVEELALLAADMEGGDDEPHHFDMSKVIKAEKKGKKGKKNRKNKEDEEEDGRGFEIDVKDERFQALHEEYEFAIDPSNPQFKKTKAMTSLLDERRKRLKDKVRSDHERRTIPTQGSQVTGAEDSDLAKLVQSVKRKTGAADNVQSNPSKRRKRS